ncbi:hypothetical protein WA026_001643 [Henosepilachna vigintioctopunctata]
MIILSICCFIGAAVISGNLYFTIEAINYGILSLFLVTLVWRIILLLEEYTIHFSSRYNNCYGKLLPHIFYFPLKSSVLFCLSLSTFVIFFMQHGFIDNKKFDIVQMALILCGIHFLRINIGLEEAPIFQSLRIAENNELDYGSALAHLYFYGYLKIILPKSGKDDKNLIELIETYSDSNKVIFPVPKLFVLIPKSCICHVSLKDNNFPNIEDSKDLDAIIQKVAGVNRLYRNSVYKIIDENKGTFYVCAEFATPLLRLKQRMEFSGSDAVCLSHQKDEIVLKFYLTLNKLLELHPEFRDFCSLIYYDDLDDRGHFRDLSRILLSQISKLRRSNKSKEKAE